MFQRDYMMRMIEQVTEAVGRVMGLRQRKEHVEALKAIGDLYDRGLRLQSRLVHTLSDEDLVKLLTTNGVADTVSLQAIALMLREEGGIHEDRGAEAESCACRIKSLALHIRLTALDAEESLSDPEKEAEALLDKLRDYELSPSLKLLIAQWRERQGRYDEAENWLHERLEDGSAAVEEAAAFYERLLQLPDDRLSAGGLPRAEVEQGLAEIREQGVR
ncbi:MAG TPA: DUF6483 family protein [Paenibacillus sp.]|uniref:DUF6483 family protein n=1 Tax=Paenibacillus sp. TaxID=58172 RepID=UPI0028D3A562|nr:DUF6483 family protein [Paenibacillus sp.]HUC92817.1 DUF6483 family protein [Paenibacillus sp.]